MWGSLQTTASVKDQTTEHTHTHIPQQPQNRHNEAQQREDASPQLARHSPQSACRHCAEHQYLKLRRHYMSTHAPGPQSLTSKKKYHFFSQPKPRRVPIPFLKENKTQWLSLMDQRRNHVHLLQLSREPSPASLSAHFTYTGPPAHKLGVATFHL